ncbi:alpha/beta hydrolase [Ornithinicoccus halotolerans]|uniref:alpha/beta hydrolase n=1 Tax=Ornithinicoccus halotolerans TaxID=1748220 RepID=UPI001296CAD6|nr:alpha/beta fold hydrolase [Ornithinicoccus halotolerans]
MPGAAPLSTEGHGPRAASGVLLVHGLTATPQMVRPVAEPLAESGYAVRAPLLPGHGTRWEDLNRTRYEHWYDAVESAAEELAAGPEGSTGARRRVVVFGVSLGGALVADLAGRRPDLVTGLVLVNPALAARDPRLRLLPLLRHLLPSLPGLADDIRRAGPPRELAYDRTPVRALHSFVGHWPRLLESLPRVRQPVLLARSAHDRVVPRLSSEVLLREIGSPDVRELWLPESGHVATLDHDADLLLRTTRDFVEELVPT